MPEVYFGVKLNRFSSSFPVGKVILKYMYPMDFEEYLLANDKELWVEEIKECYATLKPTILHEKLLEKYIEFLCIGGMPECIKEFIKCNNDILLYNKDMLDSIIAAYIVDMNKYTLNSTESVKIESVYKSIPKQLGKPDKKFRYALLKEGATRNMYETTIDWLIAGNLVNRCKLLDKIEKPLKAYESDILFKLYFNDVGILTKESETSFSDIVLDKSMMFKGVIAENYVANQLKCNGLPLYYWTSENTAKIDFVIDTEDGIIPIEVKSSENTQSKSLKIYVEKYNPKYSIRISTKNFGENNNIKSIPLYATFYIK